jgi:hypothetical protein
LPCFHLRALRDLCGRKSELKKAQERVDYSHWNHIRMAQIPR